MIAPLMDWTCRSLLVLVSSIIIIIKDVICYKDGKNIVGTCNPTFYSCLKILLISKCFDCGYKILMLATGISGGGRS